MEIKRVCVYCASSAALDDAYFAATREFARALVKEGIEVVYGGGAYGLMGTLADTVIECGGRIKGIMPKFMNEVEWAHKGLSDFEFTDTMHERKARFLEGIDGLVALPGGSGTLEELFEAITLKRLGKFTKPIVILNTRGYYDPLWALLENSVNEKFMSERHRDMWTFVDSPDQIIPAVKHAAKWDEKAIDFALMK